MTCPICHRHLVHWHWAGTDRCTCSWEDQKAAWEKQASFEPILLDRMVRQVSGQPSFEAFADAMEGGYQPTFCGLSKDKRQVRKDLADALDEEMERRGSAMRCHRCHW